MPVSLNERSALVVATGDGAVEMDLSTHNWKHAPSVPGKEQLIPTIFVKALETIPQQVCDDNMEAFVPLVELNAIGSATEATCLILGVDETAHSDAQSPGPKASPGAVSGAGTENGKAKLIAFTLVRKRPGNPVIASVPDSEDLGYLTVRRRQC
ncbi:uncharacterized protein HD556DRAFT_1443272 [Suillus plorans]|uniref:Uncharacterized protein n=1 Tax=Suillus plorans TaxID=116603 RepID=A0A9P7DIA5_9AGAM|nr:uncharacterized protein HD556DRAFT_1443272 [Suillus plorans]KAG1793891.1 hypothetical protein HD556DRAFT_1443272 [Suillus plorans]